MPSTQQTVSFGAVFAFVTIFPEIKLIYKEIALDVEEKPNGTTKPST